jgi:hypothetical protein
MKLVNSPSHADNQRRLEGCTICLSLGRHRWVGVQVGTCSRPPHPIIRHPFKEQRFLQPAGLPPATVPSPLQQNRPVLLLDFSLIIQRGCQRTPVICPCHSYAFAPCTPLNRPVSRQACLLDQYPSDAVKLPGSCQSVASLAADFHLEKKSAWRLIISPKYASTNLCRLPSIYDVHHVQARMNRPLKVLPRPGFI